MQSMLAGDKSDNACYVQDCFHDCFFMIFLKELQSELESHAATVAALGELN